MYEKVTETRLNPAYAPSTIITQFSDNINMTVVHFFFQLGDEILGEKLKDLFIHILEQMGTEEMEISLGSVVPNSPQ